MALKEMKKNKKVKEAALKEISELKKKMKHNHANQSMGVSQLPRICPNQLVGNNVPWTTCKNVIQGPLDMLPLRSKKGKNK